MTSPPIPTFLASILDICVKDRQRKAMDPEKVQELANEIERVGLLHPIVLRRPHEGEDTQGKPYVLMVGGRRTAAHVLLGRVEIEARLKDDLSPIDARIAELCENTARADLTWDEEIAARAEIAALIRQRNPSAVHSQVAAEVGVSEAQLSKDLHLHRAIQADPTLRSAPSKGSAIRIATYKSDIDRRIETVKSTGSGNRLAVLQSKITIEDARSFARRIPSQSIDLVFTDLPYGIDYFEVQPGSRKGEYDDSAETAKDFIADIVPECLRVVKPTGWVVFFMCYEWHQWLQELIHNVCRTHNHYRGEHEEEEGLTTCIGYDSTQGECKFFRPELPPWIWTRRGAGNHGHWPELHASNRYELIVIVNGGEAKLTKKPVENVLDFPPFSGSRLHSMQKPHELCREIIERTTLPGEKVLDLCFGSGAHLAAAASLNRDFIGCDINPDNLGKAISLVAQYYKQELKVVP